MTMHAVFHRPLDAQVPQGFDRAVFAMGCYWGAEQVFWRQHGVWLTQAGFTGGQTRPDAPGTGGADHAEAVRVIFDSSQVSYERLLQLFWENHDPTGGDREDDATGSRYRSLIMVFNGSQRHAAQASKVDYGNRLAVHGFGRITTQIIDEAPFWPAPDEDQQYLARNPDGHCEPTGTGVEASIPNPDTS
ncbi:peptide-methionine (S)-S-oxide reductase MsrA [Paracoccus marinaquae]|uniref:Peptide methionine sulfoxide reductase MsrA n=1 Tax=Paracoccus marinaquae TaxID=2841926 RepID=A0ABS6AJX5_9RHOB|nr:peptide-methionine (S)-S-oxide reductase MsrA [Paracoccus marinaquae]MBU3030858.1 peptide-methionine (S)-S-oxide reductase MsrA [Paracoccus marinaquae]